MVINESLIQFEVYNAGNRLLGLATIDLPELNFKVVDISGAGISGELAAPIQGATENLELKLHFRTLYDPAVKMLKHGAVTLSLRAALQNYDAGRGEVKILALRIDVRGRVKAATLGKFEAAALMENDVTLELDYIKIAVDNKVTLELDKYNFKYLLNGTDYMSDVRRALGL